MAFTASTTGKKKRTNSHAGETKDAKFTRVVPKKVNAILKSLKTIGTVGKGATVTDKHREAIENAVKEALADTLARLKGQKVETSGFKF
jgi:hypothetical protein